MTEGKKIAVSVGLGLGILVIISGLSYRSLTCLLDANEHAEHTHKVLTDLESLLSLLKDMETSQRGYLLTAKEVYLEPYKEALEQYKAQLANLRMETADNPEQQRSLTELAPLIKTILAELARTIELRRPDGEGKQGEGFKKALEVVEGGQGKQIMDQIREFLARMKAVELKLLIERTASAEASARSTLITIILGVPLAMLLVGVSRYFLLRSLSGRDDNLKAAIDREMNAREKIRQLEAAVETLRLGGAVPLKRLGQYELLAKLGQGGMGAVYKARHTLLNRMVALKVLRLELLHDPQALGRFRREMEAVGKLDHPNIVRASDAGEAEGTHFLVMELVEGLDLEVLASRQGPLPVPDACEVIRQAAVGLQHAHEHGLVHRDVKPSNLILTTMGQVKVLDLGLARLYGDQLSGGALTATGQVMGTPDYMAPEQGVGTQPVDIRADVYSLGCTLYRLLAGRAPFGEPQYDSVMKKLYAHAHTPVPPIRELRPEISPELAALLDRLLAKIPADRPRTPGEVVKALDDFALGQHLADLILADGRSSVDWLRFPSTQGGA